MTRHYCFGLALLALGGLVLPAYPEDQQSEQGTRPEPTPEAADEAILLLQAEDIPIETRIEGVRRILQAYPEDATTWAALGELYMNADEPARALGALRQAVELDSKLHSSWHWIGILEKRNGSYKEAAMAFDRARAAGGPPAVELNEKAVALVRMGRMSEAYGAWRDALTHDPGWGVLYTNAAKAALALGNEDAARDHFLQGMKAERYEETLPLMWTDHLVRSGRLKEALRDYEVALAEQPKAAKLRYYYGMTLKDEKEEEAAIHQLAIALSDALETGDRITADAVRKSLFALEHPKKMRELVKAEETIRKETDSPSPSEKKLLKAIDSMSPIIEEHPDLWEPRLMRGVALRRLGRGDDAKSDFEQVLVQVPDQPNAYLNIGLIERDLGHFEVAAQYAAKAASIAPTDPLIVVNAALVLVDAGKCDEAAQVLATARDSIPFENADEIRRRIKDACSE